MKAPSLILQIFRKQGPLMSVRGWAFVGGMVAGVALSLSFILSWR